MALSKPKTTGSTFQVENLNSEQNWAFQIVKQHRRQAFKEPLRLLVTGVGGTGKSYVIGCLAEYLGDSCILIAPTGVSALAINGATIHSTFSIPTSQLNEEATLSELETLNQEIDALELDVEFCPTEQNQDLLALKVEKRKVVIQEIEKMGDKFKGRLDGVSYLVLDELSMVLIFS